MLDMLPILKTNVCHDAVAKVLGWELFYSREENIFSRCGYTGIILAGTFIK